MSRSYAPYPAITPPPKRRLRVLLIAERANPEYTSIPLHGWSHSQAIARYADVHIVTQHWNGPAYLRAGFTDFTGIDTSVVHEPTKCLITLLRGGSEKGWTTDTALSSLEYYYFEFLVWQRFKHRIRAKAFDLVHRLIPSTPTAASLIASKCKQSGVPFVLGPLNGGLPWPAQFTSIRRREKEWLSHIREGYRLMPGYRATRECAAAIITASKATQDLVAPEYQHKCVYIPENGVDIRRFKYQRQRSPTAPLRAIFIGRLVPYKGADMLIEAALPFLQSGELTLEIVGEGPERPKLERQIQKHHLWHCVSLVGKVPHTHVPKRLAKADIFAFPSIREFGGAVVVEAMATGLACVVVDYGGPGEIVSSAVGYKIPLGSRTDIIVGFQAAFRSLIAQPEQIEQLGAQARRRAIEKFTWEAKAQRTLSVYQWALGHSPKPGPFLNAPLSDPSLSHPSLSDPSLNRERASSIEHSSQYRRLFFS